MFDVSHMVILDFKGSQVRPFLRQLLANDVDRLKDSGKALYSCMLDEQAGIIDDLFGVKELINRFCSPVRFDENGVF